MNPLVSVILPFYRKKHYFQKTIKSILKQTYKYLEIIIIYDDNENDDLPFLKKICKNDQRIKLIINKNNLGAGYSRNIGINLSKGKFIAFCDSDDLWHKKKLELQLNFLKRVNGDFCYTAYYIIDKHDQIIGRMWAEPKMTFNDLMRSCDIGLSTVILKKSIIQDKFRFPKIDTKEDYVLWLKIAKSKIRLYGLNKNLVRWRNYKSKFSFLIFRKLVDAFKVYNLYLKHNTYQSIFYTIRLSFNYVKKSLKIKFYRNFK